MDEINNRVVVAVKQELFDDVIAFLTDNIPGFDADALSYAVPTELITTDAGRNQNIRKQ